MSEFDKFLQQRAKEALKKSRVVSMPKNNISTFGNTVYNYTFVGKITENRTQVREGHIKINRPLFLTPYTNPEVFKGFSREHEAMVMKLLEDLHSPNSFFVEYQFEHIPKHDWTEKTPYPILLGEMRSYCQDHFFNVLVTGDPEYWIMSLIKFCLKIIEKSFPINFSELEERGFLDKYRIPPQIKRKVDDLFTASENSEIPIQDLGNFLVENNIFDFYEERFFDLMEKSKKNV